MHVSDMNVYECRDSMVAFAFLVTLHTALVPSHTMPGVGQNIRYSAATRLAPLTLLDDVEDRELEQRTAVSANTLIAGGLAAAALVSIAGGYAVLSREFTLVSDADNGGIGRPLSTAEVRETLRAQKARSEHMQTTTNENIDDQPLSPEEMAEDEAIMKVIMGLPNRAK